LSIVAIAAAIVGALVGTLWSGKGPIELRAGTLLSQPRPLPAFELTAHDASAFTRDDLQGRWSLVFFGFTHCPDVCPNTLFMLDKVVDRFAADAPSVVFVSVDPARDDPQRLGEYVNYLNPAFTGVTGDEANLQKLAQALSVAYELRPEGDDYTVIHSSAVLLVDPKAQLHAIFTPPLHADAIAADLAALIDY